MKPFPYFGCEDATFKTFIEKVIEGEYKTLVDGIEGQPIVLDIGANVGSFTYWALKTFPNAFVIGFEPMKNNIANFLKNMHGSDILPWQYKIVHAAIFPTEKPELTFFESENNSGMHSIHKAMTMTKDPKEIKVPVYHPRLLPDCSVLKMDTEGCEVEILDTYFKSHTNRPSVVSFEFHSAQDRFQLDEILGDDYVMASGKILHPTMGTLNYVHRNIIAMDNNARAKLLENTFGPQEDSAPNE